MFYWREVMTLYVLGTLMGFKTMKQIHHYARRHLLSYFPGLPCYAGFVHRVKRLGEGFKALVAWLPSQQISSHDEWFYLIDSFPIALAKQNHAYTASCCLPSDVRILQLRKKTDGFFS